MSSIKDRLRRAWFQGTDEKTVEGPVTSNNPETLGYPNEIAYPHKPLETTVGGDSRDWEQKWFENSAKDTKKVMGPSGEEFKLKQKMQRIPMDEKIANAKLTATFTHTAKPQDSFWTIFATDKTTGKKEEVLKATLASIWGNDINKERAYATKTQEYAKAVFERIRKDGFAKVSYLLTGDKSLLKTAQMEEMAPEVSEMPPADAPSTDLSVEIEDAAGQDANRADATGDVLQEKLHEIEEAETKLFTLLPEQAKEVGTELQSVEEELEGAINEQKEIAARLRDKTISASAKIRLISLAQESFDEATEQLLPGADEALGTSQDLLAKVDEVVNKVNEVVGEDGAEVGEPSAEVSESELGDTSPEGAPEGEVLPEDGELTASQISKFLKKRADLFKQAKEEEQKYGVVPEGAPKDGQGEIDSAHPKGGFETGGLSVGLPVANKGSRVETVSEQQKHDIGVANRMPTGELNNSMAIASSKDPRAKKLAELIKLAEVDSATKEYWAQLLYGQGDQASKEFGKDLTKDYENKVKAAVEEKAGRIKRAFELAEEAATKGMVEGTPSAKSALAEKITKFDDNAFIAYKEAVESMPVKTSKLVTASLVEKNVVSKLPIVGQKENTSNVSSQDFTDLNNLGWN